MIKRSGSFRFRGFTLVEVLLVLALVGVLAGLVAGNVGAFIAGAKFEPPDRVLKKSNSRCDIFFIGNERPGLLVLPR
ncbi:prepilin-type N-terminal cleavage/methylation domain-containing protein [Opitutales bacterium]|nr:prepilin-type N-terminal cleavage/methylation domain-containing protein [Opitutales bacterium]